MMAYLHPREVFLHLTRHLSINLVVLVVVLLLDGEDFLVCERMFSCPFLACHRRRRSALVQWITVAAAVRLYPFEWLCALMCRSSLMMHDIDQVDMFRCQDMVFCFQSGFR
jgi:hypothetical protein